MDSSRRHFGKALWLLWLGFVSGCTSQAWYEGFREQQRRQCYELTSQGEVQRCLAQVETMSYDRYLTEREARESDSKAP